MPSRCRAGRRRADLGRPHLDREIVDYITRRTAPASRQLPGRTPGVGHVTREGRPHRVAVLNSWRVFTDPDRLPFRKADEILQAAEGHAIILVDMHCEGDKRVRRPWAGTSTAGRPSVGTHRQCRPDERVLPAHRLTSPTWHDGPTEGVNRRGPRIILQRFLTQMPVRSSRAWSGGAARRRYRDRAGDRSRLGHPPPALGGDPRRKPVQSACSGVKAGVDD